MTKRLVRTEAQAKAKVRELVAEHGAGRLSISRLTLREWIVEWLADSILPNRAHRTYEAYQSRLEKHVMPTLGSKRLSDLKAGDIRALYAELRRSGAAPNQVRAIHTALRRALRVAELEGLIVRNPCDLVEPPPKEMYEAHPLDVDDARTLLTAIKGHPHEHLWRFLLWSAARFGEAAALMPDVVDEERRLAVLRRAVARLPVELRDVGVPDCWWELKEPKNAASWRTIPLSLPALAALRAAAVQATELRQAAGERWYRPDLGLLFPDDDGRPLRESKVLKRWKALLKDAGLPEETRLHDLRHSAAELALEHGAELIDVSRLLGHANITTTADIYAGRLAKSTRRAADSIAHAPEASPENVRSPLGSVKEQVPDSGCWQASREHRVSVGVGCSSRSGRCRAW
ncbi:MAG: site-specific integrase [Chloroflexota bacterium]